MICIGQLARRTHSSCNPRGVEGGDAYKQTPNELVEPPSLLVRNRATVGNGFGLVSPNVYH